jgi:hypothetical protein
MPYQDKFFRLALRLIPELFWSPCHSALGFFLSGTVTGKGNLVVERENSDHGNSIHIETYVKIQTAKYVSWWSGRVGLMP